MIKIIWGRGSELMANLRFPSVQLGVGVGVGWGFPLGLPGTRADAAVSGEKGTAFLINKSCKPLNEFGSQEVLAY